MENRKFFSHFSVFDVPSEGAPISGIGNTMQTPQETRTRLSGREKSFDDIFRRLYIIHERDGRTETDGQTAADSKDRAYA